MDFLPLEPSWERKAINRTTFGCRDVDEQYVQKVGWETWVQEQLDPPDGDDAEMASHLAAQTLRIHYGASNQNNLSPESRGWDAVDENRPFNYLSMPEDQLYQVLTRVGDTHPGDEYERVYEETMNSVYMRATHSSYQLREVMTDFWLNHFSVWYDGPTVMRVSVLVYDRDVIRPRVFGNFRDMLGAVAQSTAMQWYLDNAHSTAALPNENYARELMELHTLGEDVYLGTIDPETVEKNADGVAVGFTDKDVIEVSRALSGWTVEVGQSNGVARGRLPNTWLFTYNPVQHNTEAGLFMGQDLAGLTGDMEQGNRVLDILADHPATAAFVTGKIVRRLFGEDAPQTVLDRALTTWMDNRDSPNQIRLVLETILLDGTEIGDATPARLRRPFEKIVGAWRVMGATIEASPVWASIGLQTKDAAFGWSAPNGRPNANGYWFAGIQVMEAWSNLYRFSMWNGAVGGDLFSGMPEEATDSAIAMTDYWIGKMIGYELGSADGYNALVDFTFTWAGPMSSLIAMQNAKSDEQREDRRQDTIRNMRGFASLIATADEFAWI